MARIDLDAEFGRMREYKSPTVSSGVGETATGLQQDAQMADMIRERDPFQATASTEYPRTPDAEPTEICPNCGEMTTFHYGHCNKCEQYVRNDLAPLAEHRNTATGSSKLWESACFGSPKPDIELSLLVIDLGDSCVVKVEKGEPINLMIKNTFHVGSNSGLSTHPFPFADVRAAIDGEKPPLPRIERTGGGSMFAYGLIFAEVQDEPERNYGLMYDDYNALCELAGVTIPVWTGGEWVQIYPADVGNEWCDRGFKAWRYTRR